jgi:hypothetical protein
MQSKGLSLRCAYIQGEIVRPSSTSLFFPDSSETAPSRSFWQRGGAYGSMGHVVKPGVIRGAEGPRCHFHFPKSIVIPKGASFCSAKQFTRHKRPSFRSQISFCSSQALSHQILLISSQPDDCRFRHRIIFSGRSGNCFISIGLTIATISVILPSFYRMTCRRRSFRGH